MEILSAYVGDRGGCLNSVECIRGSSTRVIHMVNIHMPEYQNKFVVLKEDNLSKQCTTK